VKFLTLDSEQVVQVQRDSHDFWGGGLSLEERVSRLLEFMRIPDPPLTCVGLVDDTGRVVSSAKLYFTRLVIGGREVEAMGVGAVFTPETWRGQGLAKTLLARCDAWARARNVAWAWLWSDIGADYYAKMGYVPFERRGTSIPIEPQEAMPQGMSVRPAEAGDIAWMRALYHRCLSSWDVFSTREAGAWSFWRSLNDSNDFVVTRDGEPIGFFAGAFCPEYFWIEESFAAEADAPDHKRAMAAFLASRGVTKARAWRQDGMALGEGVDEGPRAKPIPMVKCLDPSLSPLDVKARVFFSGADHY
jgi:predicted N-acetyltransferase YhbS